MALGFGNTVAKVKAVIVVDTSQLRSGLASAQTQIESLGGRLRSMGGNWKFLTALISGAGLAILGFTGNMGALAPLIPILTVALTGLLVPFTTLAALVVALIGPLSVLGAVLGGVVLGAMLGFKGALDSTGKQFAPFRRAIDSLKDGFKTLTHSLAVAFMPWFMKMAPVAKDVLNYFNQLAKIAGKSGLSGVFKSLADGGFARLNKDFLKFIGPIGDLISKTIAFAFGTGGGEGQSILKSDFKRFTAWLSTAFQPIIKWFDRQDFTKTGYRWGSELAGAIVKVIGAAISKVFTSPAAMMIGGGAAAGAGIGLALGGPIGAALGAAIGAAAGIILNHYWPKIVSEAQKFWAALPKYIEKILGPALWNQVKSLARSFGDTVKAIGGFFKNDVWPVVKKIWDKLGGWHTVIVIIVGVIRIIVGLYVAMFDIIRKVYNSLKSMWDAVSQVARAIAGGVVSAWHAVMGVIHAIASFITGLFHQVGNFAGAVSGGLKGAWDAVSGVVHTISSVVSGIIGGLDSALSKASSLASKFSSFPGKALSFFGLAGGGLVQGGTPGKDSVPAMLMPGEVVLSRHAVQRLGGPHAANSLNMGSPIHHFAKGGIVPPKLPTSVAGAPQYKNPSWYKDDRYWAGRLGLAEKELKRALKMPKGKARDTAIRNAQAKIHNIKAAMANNSPKLATWLSNKVSGIDATMQFNEQTWDTQFQNTGDVSWFNKEQAQRLQEVSLFQKAAAFARSHHLTGDATSFGRSAITTYQDYQTAAQQQAGSAASVSASEIAGFLSNFSAFQSAAGSNVSFFGAASSPNTTTAGANGAASSGTTVHVHQSFVSTDDQFTHMRRARVAAQSVFGS